MDKEETKFWDRVITCFWWNVMGFAWFIGIFSKKVFEHNERWLIGFGLDHKAKIENKK